jgi:sterol desaturase/sphingolipid hydroxylase (fatty acid hydroxylase superfamily)
MGESALQVIRMAAFAAAALSVLAIQRLAPHDESAERRWVNVALWLINGTLVSVICGACACTVARWAEMNHFGALNALPIPGGVALVASIFVLDFVSYGWHRANHRLPLLWRFHQLHHSDLNFTASTAVRFHPGELLLSLPIRLLAVVLIGAPATAVVAFEVVFTWANFFEHGNITLPLRFERRLAVIMVTPALHRRHHANVRPQLDTNFGTVFSIWDRFLGTYGANTSAARFATGLPSGRSVLTVGEALTVPFHRI